MYPSSPLSPFTLIDKRQLQADLRPCWLVLFAIAAAIAAGVAYCLIADAKVVPAWPEALRIQARTICYVCAIIAFPLTNLVRHVQMRLNATMPGSKAAKRRYLASVTVSMVAIGLIGIMGMVLFMVGDGVNTLYIFSALTGLGLFLYRPKSHEYESIIRALSLRPE
jgi:hypothetical protein